MDKLTELSPFASTCLEFIKKEYPQFIQYIVPSDIYINGWSLEIPWPEKSENVGIIISVRMNRKWEVLRIDFGYMDAELFPHSYKTIEELLKDASKIIENILGEKTVLIDKWIKENEYFDRWFTPDYSPENDDENRVYKIRKIRMRSWKGTYNKEWELNY